jgi:adenine-specific DNA-methyltransferase
MEKQDKLTMHTANIVDANFSALAKMFPNAVTETVDENGEFIRAIDAEVLAQEINTRVISGKEERYQFTWPDKKKSVLLANAPIAATLRPSREESVDFDKTENLYIEGDNLDVLKLLRETYLNRVKMVYIDPPYNTGKDFIYEDNFAEETSVFLKRDGQYDEQGNRLTSNFDSNGRFHTDWLNMMYPRLRVARDVLTDDGVIFISIDDNELSNLIKLCDEVFGENNFIGQITLISNPKGRSHDKYIANCHDILLIYSKTERKKGEFSIDKTYDEINKDYPLEDFNGQYREIELRNTHREFGKHNRPNLYYPIYVKESGKIVLDNQDDSIEVFPIWDDGFEGCWTWGKDKAKNELGLLVGKEISSKWKIYRKAYALIDNELPKKQMKSIWQDKKYHTEKGQKLFNELFKSKNKIFQSPKSLDLISDLIKMGNSSNDIILDFFSGSATTAHAVMQLNSEDGRKRKFIMVQIPESCDEKSEAYKAGYKTICEIGKERIRRAGAKIKEENKDKEGIENLDTGFRVLKLDSSNMKEVYYTPEEYSQMGFNLEGFMDNIKHDRSDEDLLFQVMLDLGIPLSAKIEQDGNIFNVNDNYLIACFDRVDTAMITEIAQKQPYYAVFRDSSFMNDSALVNVEQIFNTYSPSTIRRVL